MESMFNLSASAMLLLYSGQFLITPPNLGRSKYLLATELPLAQLV